MDPLHSLLGIKLTTVIAGFLGGLARALIMPGVTWSKALFSCVVGAITAGYLTPFALHWFSYSDVSGAEGAIGYLIGLTAMLIVEGVLNAAKKWKDDPSLPPRDKP